MYHLYPACEADNVYFNAFMGDIFCNIKCRL